MKRIIGLLIIAIALLACKSGKRTQKGETVQGGDDQQQRYSGVVSHKYRAGGCPTVIIAPNGGDTLVLIPTSSLGKLDVDGQRVTFSYHALRMPNPEGCVVGHPATIVGIQKEK
jgi:hypothetical protein